MYHLRPRFTALVIRMGLFVLLTAAMSGRASAEPVPRFSDIMPISQVKAGMIGYGLTVFRGTTVEKFAVTVVGVVKKGSLLVPGHDMILVRMSGGPMTTRQAYLIRGMSGSPVYINGKIIGAFSQGEPTSKEPLGGVTPIEDMLEAWDPKLPASPSASLPHENGVRVANLPQPIDVAGRRIQKVVYNVPLKSGLRSHGSTLVMHPCTTFATFSSASKTVRAKLAKALEPYNVELIQGVSGGEKTGFKGAPLVPGSAFSMMLVTGDLSMGATGTVSYRRGNRILGFGHPFMGIGPIEAPLCSAWIYDVYPLTAGSYKISSPGPIIGSSSQDRNFSISGILGMKPRSIPVTVDVKDLTTGRNHVFHSNSVTHPNLYSALVSSSVGAAISEIRSTPGAAMARVTTTVDAEEIGKISRTNIFFDARGIDGAATADLDDLLGVLTGNPFYPLGIKSAEVKVEIESGRKTAQVERIFLKEGKFEPGETAEIGIVIKPYKEPAVTKTVKIAIPQNTPTGKYMLQIKGGAVPSISFGGMLIRPGGSGGDQSPPVSVRQMVDRYNEREKNNEIVARLILPTLAVNVEGEKLNNLPPSLDTIIRSSKSSGVRMERDEVKVVEPTDWVISGQQVLNLSVQRKDIQESPASGGSGGVGATSPNSFSGGSGGDGEFSASINGGTGLTGLDDDMESALSVLGLSSLTRNPNDNQEGKVQPVVDKTDKPAKKEDPKTTKKGDTKGKKSDSGTQTAASTTATTTPPEADKNDKPVARQPIVWRQTTRADFAKGDSKGVSVTTTGDLSLTRTLAKLQTSTESFLWTLVADGKGGLYAGTGTQARILHLDSKGALTVFAKLPEITVHGLYLASDGALWAATGPNGRIYRITPDGKSTVAYQAAEKYALAITGDSKGNVYVGTGGGRGTIYRIEPNEKTTLFFQTSEEHVLALAVDKNDRLYAGTSNDGIVYRILPDGKGSVIYDAPEASITSLGVNSKGEIYAVTAPRGVIYKIDADGAAKTIYDKAASAYTSLRVASDDTVYAASGSSVYAVRPDDSVIPFANRNEVDILSLTVGEGGTLYAGTGNVAEVYCSMQSQPKGTGVYESVIHDAKQVARWGSVRWTAVTPTGTQLFLQTRTGNVADPDSTWSGWETPQPTGDGARISSPPARFIQYRVQLESDAAGVSPALRDVAITYLPRNQAPKVTFTAPAGGERWAKQQTLKWDASDPDKDTLSSELYYSSDNGAHWSVLPVAGGAAVTPPTTAVIEKATKDVTPPSASVSPSVPPGSGPPTVEAVTAELDKHPDLPPALREAILERARKVNAEFQTGQTAGTTGVSAAPSPSATRETSRSLDTKTLPDGTYLFKVKTSDRPSNPLEAQAVEAVSEPIVICNALPTVVLIKSEIKTLPDRVFTVTGTALQKTIAITAVQYRVDNGEWTAAVPSDGIFDSTLESFQVTTASLTPGKHTIEVKAFNAANNTVVETLTIEAK